ncbi:E3 ubiquitin-protein ligase TRIM7-like [Elgaria multicarinata webbii]|uniref:E3 ubiquitin-protein ligase TRIM7-like n=1 Tax=Elgaria multicarinata webbii TaxID=159646 RepID=UPI002FCD0653
MAAGSPHQELFDEATCSICLEYFRDPVTTNCGHNFCRACLKQCWGRPNRPASCPQCRAMIKWGNIRPNRKLGNLAAIIRKIEEQKSRKGERGVCQMLFCKDDQALICMVCDTSKEHRGHHLVPMEEAAQEYKETIEAQQQSLKKKREKIIEKKLAEDQRNQKCLIQIGKEKQKIKFAFQKMQSLLQVKESHWMAQLGDLEKEAEKRWKENTTSFSEEISRLSQLISEMEKKCQQPASEFLKDIRSTLSRCQDGQLRQVVELSPGPEESLRSYSEKIPVLKKAMENFEGSLKEKQSEVNVILDPDTAHPFLILGEDLTRVRWEERYQDLPYKPGRFDREFCVLGCERFTSGRHWWEVEVDEEDGAMWAVGVARESVRRKGIFKLTPQEGVWAVGKRPHDSHTPCRLSALTSPEWTPLTLRNNPRKIRVSLDNDGGCVEFFDADTDEMIFTFSSASFSGEKIQPFFWVVSGVRISC